MYAIRSYYVNHERYGVIQTAEHHELDELLRREARGQPLPERIVDIGSFVQAVGELDDQLFLDGPARIPRIASNEVV